MTANLDMASNKLDRRSFLKAGAIGAASVPVLANSPQLPADILQADPSSISEHRTIALNHSWLFSEKFTPEALQPKFDDSRFVRVTVPHTNKMLPMNGFDEKDYTFVSVYRNRFRLPRELNVRRAFVDFGGVMTAAKVYLNGQFVGENLGGYNDFSFELTKYLNAAGENVLAVEVDSTERKDIPPFGGEIDYLTFGGIYRDVQLRFVNETFIEDVFAKPKNVLERGRSVNVKVFLARSDTGSSTRSRKINAELLDGSKILSSKTQTADLDTVELDLSDLSSIELWELDRPKLYLLRVTLAEDEKIVDDYETRIGFREAKFTPKGFYLNGEHLKLRGLNRHQTFPFVGQAMPARVQKRDAWILKKELKCNIVRTSHYLQSPHFLDACDEYGLLVLEEIPGWQHVGDKAWQDISVRDVESMVKRDWNHPSIILWGVRINESGDNHEFYTRTNAMARSLDDSRPTCGIRNNYNSEFLEDVFTMNDFGFPLRPPNHPLYLNTEFNGHMYPTKRTDNVERIREQTHRHARIHDQLASDDRYAGGLGWCAFDYNTHGDFGSGDRICYHGVSDIFRIPKPAAGFYRSQCEPSEEVVLEPAFDWARGDENEGFGMAIVCSNCDKLKFYIGGKFITEAEPDRKTYPHLKFAPFNVKLWGWGDLLIEGYIGGRKVIERKMSGKGVDKQLIVEADDHELKADGIDTTRVVFRVADEFGNTRQFAHGAIQFTIENGTLIGENPFALIGGSGAVWVRSTETKSTLRLAAIHPRLGIKTVEIKTV